MIVPVHSNTFIMIAALIRPPLLIEAAPEGGVGHLRLHPGGGGMVKGGPPFLVVGGRLHPGQSGLHTTLPWVQPTPPWLPVPPWVQFKFPRVINFDSPLNDSRQLEWVQLVSVTVAECRTKYPTTS